MLGGRQMNGLCHRCFSSNQLLTLDTDGVPKCAECFEYDLTHKHQMKTHAINNNT